MRANDIPATPPAPQRPALSAASQEAVRVVTDRLRDKLCLCEHGETPECGCWDKITVDLAPLVARLAALEADVQRNREQVEQSAGMLMALRTENAEWR